MGSTFTERDWYEMKNARVTPEMEKAAADKAAKQVEMISDPTLYNIRYHAAMTAALHLMMVG